MLKNLFKSDFVKNSSTLIIGTVLAQIIPIALQPIIRRTYTDAETGRFDLYLSIIAILASFVHLNYARTVVIPKKETDAINLLGGALLSSFAVSLLIFILILIGGKFFLNLFNLPLEILPWLKYIPLSVFAIGSYTSINFWLTRKKQFKEISFNKFIRRGTEGIAQVTTTSISSNGLILGTIIGDLVNLFIHTYQLAKSNFSLSKINWADMKQQLFAYKDFPIYSLLPTLLNTLSANIPVIMITSFFSDKIAGQFGLSRMVLAIPLALISVALSQVLLQKVSEKRHNNESIYKIMKGTFFALIGMSLVGTLIITLFSDQIFTFAFGEGWLMASQFTQVLIFYFAVSFIATPLSSIFISLKKIKINSIWQIIHFSLIISLYFFKDLTVINFIYAYTIINVLSYIVYGVLIYIVINQYEKQIIK